MEELNGIRAIRATLGGMLLWKDLGYDSWIVIANWGRLWLACVKRTIEDLFVQNVKVCV